MKVAELMTTDLRTISVDATVADAVDALATTGVSALPVLDRFGRPVGVVSTREVLKAEAFFDTPEAREILFEQTLVLEIMQAWPPTIHPGAGVTEAAREMLYLETSRLFVEEHGALVGVISQTDIVGALATAKL